MAGVQPLGPAYPGVPARKAGDEERGRRRKPAERKPERPGRKDGGKSGGNIDEYA